MGRTASPVEYSGVTFPRAIGFFQVEGVKRGIEDADAAFDRGPVNGATVVDAQGDKEWGGRYGGFQDPFGHIWYIATPIEER